MKELILHQTTRRQLEVFVKKPAHALLLVAPTGSGKRTLAIRLSEMILGLDADSFEDYPYKMLVADQEGKAIGIEAVREIERFLSLKVPDSDIKEHNRPIIIENAHLLTLEAQNALLKTLEEPPQGTFIILTSNSEQALLPTIRSRARLLAANRPEQSDVEAYFQAKGADAQAIRQAFAISGGLPGLMQALLGESDHPMMAAVQYARQLLSQPVYERLLSVDELSKQKQLALDVTFILQQMARVSLQTATGHAADKWQRILSASYDAGGALSGNAQSKLVLTNLMLSF